MRFLITKRTYRHHIDRKGEPMDKIIEELCELVKEWREKKEFLVNNSTGSDISVGNTYGECAGKLIEIIGRNINPYGPK
jgi:hypothetical protein